MDRNTKLHRRMFSYKFSLAYHINMVLYQFIFLQSKKDFWKQVLITPYDINGSSQIIRRICFYH